MNYFDAHLHWFKDSAFGDRLAGALGGRPDIRYYEDKYRARGRLAGGIVMGNGPLTRDLVGCLKAFSTVWGLMNRTAWTISGRSFLRSKGILKVTGVSA